MDCASELSGDRYPAFQVAAWKKLVELIRDTEADVQALPASVVCAACALTFLTSSAVVLTTARLGACTATWGLQRFPVAG